MKRAIIISILIFFILSSGCQILQPVPPTATPVPPTPTPEPRFLTICLGNEPEMLFPLAAASRSAWSVLEAIYDGPIDILDGQPTPVILETLPTRQNGGISLTPVEVKTGDLVADSRGNLTSLAAGIRVFPSGCASPECVISWDGITPLTLDQMSARFTLKPNLVWSDGKPLSMDDSLYSFEVASDPAMPVDKHMLQQTSSYKVNDALNLQWQGLPGLVVADVSGYFRMPLPRHAWGGIPTLELLSSPLSSRSPLGWGAYVLAEWKPGESIRLVKNPLYFRASEGLPKFDTLTFKFLTGSQRDGVAAVKSGLCDLVLPEATDMEQLATAAAAKADGTLAVTISPGNSITFLALGIKPAAYDDSYYPFGTDRPDLFGDVRTRQAIAQCINRQAIMEDLLGGNSSIPSSFVSYQSSLRPEAAVLPFDQAAGIALLDQVGWKDFDKNPLTALTALNVKNVPDWRKLEVTLVTTDSYMDTTIAQRVQSDLAACGIPVTLTSLPLEQAYQTAPDGVIFGRRFDMALLSMRVNESAPCGLFTSDEIPMASNYWMGALRGGNFSGYTNAEVDAACTTLSEAGDNTAIAQSASTTVLRLTADELPFIPLFYNPVILITRSDACGVELSTNGRSTLTRLEGLNYGDGCP